mgnify:CR=1 FL=1
MGVTISASHPEGHEISHRYAEVDGAALTIVIRALCAEMDEADASLHPMPDPDDYAFYGASIHDADPTAFRDALKRVMEKEDPEVCEAIDVVGMELLVTLHEANQTIRLDVMGANSKHFATVSTTGTMADEPTIDCTGTTATAALASYGLVLPNTEACYTFKAADITSKPTPSTWCADRLKAVAEYAVRTFGPDAEIVVG